ncbi:FAD-dependent oxidoreductase [Lentzea sp. NPDC060358]|uniref:FAD-dependent oxidoreductase n=1 Tax=Lentzea sp. NPDC060358 TaxID=3347103 RepID=UPI003661A583
MRIIVIGAGVSGVLSAHALIAAGHDVEVHEKAPSLRAGGNGVMVWHNGTAILRDLGVDTDGLGRRIDRMDVWSHDGRRLMRTDMAALAREFGSPGIGMLRGALVRRVADHLPPGTVHFGRELVAIRQPAGGGVEVEFAGGDRVRADVLLGADGYRSAVRDHMFGDDPPAPTGLSSWHGSTSAPVDLGDDHVAPTYYGKTGLFTLHPVGGGVTHWAFEMPWRGTVHDLGRAHPDAGQPGTRLATLRSVFGGWAGPVRQVLDAIDDADIRVAPHTVHRVRPQWGRGAVTLVGDSAHAVPARIGMGVNQALEDVWVLAKALNGTGDPAELLRAYEKVRVPVTRRVRSRARMMKFVNPALLALRVTKDGLAGTSMLRASIVSSSSYLGGDRGGLAPIGDSIGA